MDGSRLEPETVGLVGDDVEWLREAVREAGFTPHSIPEAGADAHGVDIVLAAGEAGLLDVVRAAPDTPILPVEAGRGVRSVPRDSIGRALAELADTEASTESHPLLDVAVAGESVANAFLDVTLVTAEPAHISEFGVHSRGEAVARFRADGIVAATPAGTTEYANAAGSPVIPAGPDVLSLIPIAPFATSLDRWVVPIAPVELAVCRDEAVVDLQVDDRTVRSVGPADPVTLGIAGSVDILRLPQSLSPFDDDADRSEKL